MLDPVTGLLVSAALSGVIGNRADQIAVRSADAVVRRILRGGAPVNHDLARAVRRAYLRAAEQTCLAFLERHPDRRRFRNPPADVAAVDALLASVREQVRALRDREHVPVPNPATQTPELLALPAGLADTRVEELRGQLYDVLLVEIRTWGVEPPAAFEAMLRDGWHEPGPPGGDRVDFFALLCAFFVDELKRDERVQRVFTAGLLADLPGVSLRLDSLVTQWEDFGRPAVGLMESVRDELREVKQLLIARGQAGTAIAGDGDATRGDDGQWTTRVMALVFVDGSPGPGRYIPADLGALVDDAWPAATRFRPRDSVWAAAMESVGDAIVGAVAAVEAGVRLPMAVHVGEVRVRGAEVRGLDVHRGLRVLALATPRQVLLSGPAADDGHAGQVDGVGVVELGHVHLPGVTEPERIAALAHPVLRSSGLGQSGRSSRHNLPVQLTTFVGRVDDLGNVVDAVRDRRLTTIVGPGGAGKTRLALQAAASLVGDFAHGVWVAELTQVADGRDIGTEVARAMGLQLDSRSGPDAIVDELAHRELLLVLDNCEHLVEGAAWFVDRLLTSSDEARVLATSREPLGVPGELAWPIPLLNLPDSGLPIARLEDESDAVGLFVERARSALPGFALSEATAPMVVSICRRLDGLPLGIELAAAQVPHLSIDQLHQEVVEGLDAWEAPYRTVPARQRTLQATLAWSYDMLTADEQQLFRALAVFAGLFSRDDVVGMAGADGRAAARDLQSLVAKSLVAPARRGTLVHYRLLETVRAAATSWLEAAGEFESAAKRHARHYFELAGQAGLRFSSDRCAEWVERMELAFDSLTAALEWGRANDPTAAAEAFAAVEEFWLRWTDLRRAVLEADAFLATDLPARVRSRMLAVRARLAPVLSGYSGLDQYLDEIDAMDPGEVDPAAVFTANALRVVRAATSGGSAGEAMVAGSTSPGDAVARWLQAARDAAERAGPAVAPYRVLTVELMADWAVNGVAAAAERAMTADIVSTAAGHPFGLSQFLNELGSLLIEADRPADALALLERFPVVAGGGADEAWLRLTRAESLLLVGRPAEALAVLRPALEHGYRTAVSTYMLESALTVLAAVLAATSQPDLAAIVHEVAEAVRQEQSEPVTPWHQRYHALTIAGLAGVDREMARATASRISITDLLEMVDDAALDAG